MSPFFCEASHLIELTSVVAQMARERKAHLTHQPKQKRSQKVCVSCGSTSCFVGARMYASPIASHRSRHGPGSTPVRKNVNHLSDRDSTHGSSLLREDSDTYLDDRTRCRLCRSRTSKSAPTLPDRTISHRRGSPDRAL